MDLRHSSLCQHVMSQDFTNLGCLPVIQLSTVLLVRNVFFVTISVIILYPILDFP